MSEHAHAPSKPAATAHAAPTPSPLLRWKATTTAEPAEAPPIVHEVLASSGQPLDPTTLAEMGARFGHDFSQVRVHTDAQAAESAAAVNARAYTVGRDVVFGAGQYAPGTSAGQRVMAHELTHVVQHDHRDTLRDPERQISSPGESSEREARGAADAAMIGRSIPSVTAGSASLLHRDADTSGQTAGGAASSGQNSRELLYTFRIYGATLADQTYHNIPALQAEQVIRNALDVLNNLMDANKGKLNTLIRNESGWNRPASLMVGTVNTVRKATWHDIWIGKDIWKGPPSPAIYDMPNWHLKNVKSTIDSHNIQMALVQLQSAAQSLNEANRKLQEWYGELEEGAKITEIVIEVAAATAVTALTAGATSGLAASGLEYSLGEKVVIGGVAQATRAMTGEATQQGLDLYFGKRKGVDAKQVLSKGFWAGVAGAAGTWFGEISSEVISEAISEEFASYIGEEVSDAELASLNLTRTSFMTNRQIFVSKFFGDRGKQLAEKMTEAVVDSIRRRISGDEHEESGEKKPKNVKELSKDIVADMAAHGAKDLFVEIVRNLIPGLK